MDKIPLYADGWLITVQENFEFIAKKQTYSENYRLLLNYFYSVGQ
jgi:hypothetical protein